MMYTFGFDGWRAAFVMLTGIDFSGSEQFLLSLGDKRFIFAMRGDDDAQFLRKLKRAIKFRVVHAERALVGEINLERADAPLDDFAELLFGLVVELRHTHVKGEITRGLANGLAHPQLKTCECVVFAGGGAHFDKRGRAANKGGLAGSFVSVFCV